MSTKTSSAPEALIQDHDQAVKRISETIRGFYDKGLKFRIKHGSTNSTRTARKGTNFVDLSRLDRVLHVDTVNKTALVEPNVPMDRLVEATMPHGLIPPVVMEFPGITTGGGYAGTSGESSSFKHGFFDRTLDWVEIVLANGEVIRCSEQEHSDLFRGAAGAVGSIGTTTLVQLRLEDAKPFVEVTYHPIKSTQEAVDLSKKMMQDSSIDYLDGIIFSKTQGAVITGRRVETPSANTLVRRFSSRSDPWFYLHVQSCLEQRPSSPTTETVPLAEYLFRYDRGGFWVAPMSFEYFRFPFNHFTRWFLDDFLHTRMMYTALHSGGVGREIIIQDLGLPMDTAAEFTDYTHDKFGIYPLWLCPLKTRPGPSFHPHQSGRHVGTSNEIMMNIGLWGWAPHTPKGVSQRDHSLALNRDLEATLAKLGGKKWLYAKTFYPEHEFWADHVGGREWYDELRKKYHATGLPTAYEKTHTDIHKEWDQRNRWKDFLLNVWPLGGLWGVWKAIRSQSYKEARASAWKSFGLTQAADKKQD
ncbi:FAD-binding domain-containing protein [Myriangium duriaei CBS 260.36]|uniref:Delta(24)-sterol reductase n=1 Tax=Myriangium duriaei CBS 260.36 TaxID=1168546 RepID=A0A9P4J8G7_9PEZI|nr:FAD-binding domain-containing protein [Myriangium duriaei CBS 260.36]